MLASQVSVHMAVSARVVSITAPICVELVMVITVRMLAQPTLVEIASPSRVE